MRLAATSTILGSASLTLVAFACAPPSARTGSLTATQVVVGSVSPADAAPPPPSRGPLRVRKCHVETTSRRVLTVADVTFGADAAGDVVEIRVKAGDMQVSIDRQYDAARRFSSERRRFTSPEGEVLTTFTWQRDDAGNVTQAERVEERHGGTSPSPGRRIVTKVT
jgi:hypothetical protein